jgi:hypothetical protein
VRVILGIRPRRLSDLLMIARRARDLGQRTGVARRASAATTTNGGSKSRRFGN